MVWQPFQLGFYVDDWYQIAKPAAEISPFSADLFHFLRNIDPARPGLWPIKFLLVGTLRGHPLAWQACLVGVNALIAILLVKVIRAVGLFVDRKTDAIAPAIGLCWMLLPWNAATSFWPTLLSIDILLAIFAATLLLLLRAWTGSARANVFACLLYLYLCIGYEAYYFQFLPLVAIGAVLAYGNRVRTAAVARSAMGLAIAQALAIAWFFLAKHWGLQQPTGSNVGMQIVSDLYRLAPQMLHSLHEIALPFASILIATLALLVLAVRKSARATPWRDLLVAGSALVGGIISIVAFSLGARTVAGTGVESRVLSILSFWLIIAAALLASTLLSCASRPYRIAFLSLAGLLGVMLGAGRVLRAADWAHAWSAQNAILRAAPVDRIEKTESNAAILYINTPTIENAPIFVAPWDLLAAMPLAYGNRVARMYVVYNPRMGPLVWNGSELAYARQSVARDVPIYVWQPGKSFLRANAPFRVGPDLKFLAF